MSEQSCFVFVNDVLAFYPGCSKSPGSLQTNFHLAFGLLLLPIKMKVMITYTATFFLDQEGYWVAIVFTRFWYVLDHSTRDREPQLCPFLTIGHASNWHKWRENATIYFRANFIGKIKIHMLGALQVLSPPHDALQAVYAATI